MIDDVGDIAAYYDDDPRDEHGRLDANQLEWELTCRFLGRHLPHTGSILDIGTATGRYAVRLCAQGYTVTGVDLSVGLIEKARSFAASSALPSTIRFETADARDLSRFADDAFDGVLLFGPLYHLVDEEDRRLAIREAYRVLRPGGVLASAVLSRLGVLGDLMRRVPEWVEDSDHVTSFLDRGRRPDGAPPGGFRGYFAQASEVAPLHEAEGFDTLTLAGIEPAISAHDESFNALEGSQRTAWLDVLESVSTEPSIIGASRHLLYVGQKAP